MATDSTAGVVSYQDVLQYWYADRIKPHWFSSTPQLDQEIRTRFEACWKQAGNGKLNHWAKEAEGALALIIILDQLPLNMYRGDAKSFSTEQQAVTICKRAINDGLDKKLPQDKLAFFYMPLMHSENLQDQDLSISLYQAAGLEDNLKFARHHRDIIRRFGRFPHRNSILGRNNTAEETAYLASKGAFTG